MLTEQELQTLCNLGHDDAVQEIEALRADAWRFRKLQAAATEQLLSRPREASEIMPDMRTHWTLPVLICSGPVGGHVSFAEAVDNLPGQASTLDAGAEKG